MAAPCALHAPDVEGVTEALVRDVRAGGGEPLVVRVRVQDLVQEVYIADSQLQRLDLGELVGGQRRDDLSEGGEGLVQALGALSLAYIGEHPRLLQLLVALGGFLLRLRQPRLFALVFQPSLAPSRFLVARGGLGFVAPTGTAGTHVGHK